MNKYKGKYRIESNRLQNWDYSSSGYYFLTLVSQNRKNWFGEIEDEILGHSIFGDIVKRELEISTKIRQELFLDEYILMPNHLHLIVVIKSPVETHGHASLRNQRPPKPNLKIKTTGNLHRKPKSISSFVAGFKSSTTNKIDDYIDEQHLNIEKFNRNNRLWQPNYHDRIIRNENELFKIRQYIQNNPNNWQNDNLRFAPKLKK